MQIWNKAKTSRKSTLGAEKSDLKSLPNQGKTHSPAEEMLHKQDKDDNFGLTEELTTSDI